MYLRARLGQDVTSSDLLANVTAPLSAITAPTDYTSFLSSPLFLIGLGLLGLAYLLSRGGKVLKKRRRSYAKRQQIKSQIAALKAEL